ncbi:flagellar biosynthesis protein FlhB [Patulibacter defluvii]|uniref:flagellar biosynthesis protein FlhB n=1 Tax=Patulibacter defluvii TaxID=3095358 RepID=UPI002A75508D|nr:flagellar biosynthesis protein FlhB [Patulibacter sp. DM4]
MASGEERTEKATPRKREETRGKGQVARSTDLTGAVVLLAGLLALSVAGPGAFGALQDAMRASFALIGHADGATAPEALPGLATAAGAVLVRVVAPVAAAVAVAAVVINLAQVNVKLTPKALKPDFRKLDPLQGAKNLFGKNALVETLKAFAKMLVIGVVTALVLVPRIDEIAELTGVGPQVLAAAIGDGALDIALRAAAAYLVIGALDLVWQRRRHEKQIRMTRQEVRMEQRQQDLPPEVRMALRQRQTDAARRRMMADVATADVVIANPTHVAVALRYVAGSSAPTVVAKGLDLVALRIRERAREHGVAVVEEPPLARALHRQVEVGQAIPEQLYQAVAEVLAFVYRVGRRRVA